MGIKFEFKCFLKTKIESLCLTCKGKLFQSLMVAGRKELKYMFVLACIVCMSSAFRRLYGLFSLVYGGTKFERISGVRRLTIFVEK